MSQESIATMLNGAIAMYSVVALYTQRGWIPYLKEKLSGWKPSISLPAFTTTKKPPSLQTAAEYIEELVLYFDQYGCTDGKEHAVKCGELLSHAMFCGKVKDASPKT